MNFMRWGSKSPTSATANKGWTDEVEAMDKPAGTLHSSSPNRRKASLNALSVPPTSASAPSGGSGKAGSTASGQLPSAAASSSSTLSSSSSSSGPSLEEKAQEYERRINVLTYCLEEQVMENAQLQKRLDTITALYAPPSASGPSSPSASPGSSSVSSSSLGADPTQVLERVKALQAQLQEREDQLERLHEAHAKVEEERDDLRRELAEVHKKMDALARELDDLKANGAAAGSSSTVEHEASSASPAIGGNAAGESGGGKNTNWKDRYEREKRDKKRMEDLVFNYEETIERLKKAAKAKDKKQRDFAARLDRERERRAALQESNEEYEKKLQTLEKDLMDALHKEGERRMEAEYWQDVMRKKLKKLKRRLKKLKAANDTADEGTSESDPTTSDSESTLAENENEKEAAARAD